MYCLKRKMILYHRYKIPWLDQFIQANWIFFINLIHGLTTFLKAFVKIQVLLVVVLKHALKIQYIPYAHL